MDKATNDDALDTNKLRGELSCAFRESRLNDNAFRDGIEKLFERLVKEIHSLRAANEELEKEDDDEEDSIEAVEAAVHRFLDTVNRPVGTRDFTVPQSGEARDAIIGLYDAIGRAL